ncbi:MAG: zinc-binding alcohol dehydrogenase [Kiritimatiellae bacterium]|nr:zinc-binding alcohol dehydrogenase [Kiritimatiellia bacterium]
MKARRLICRAARQIEVEEFDVALQSDDDILVENAYTAVSVGTELWDWVHGSNPGAPPRAYPRGTGYCNCGTVLEVGKNVTYVQPGDRVAGQTNHASHAVVRSYYRKVPDGVSSKSASLLVMAAIAMHGIRVAKIELGEAVAVVGLGLVGQFSITLARLCGAVPVIAIDLDEFRLAKAGPRGAEVLLNPAKADDIVAAVRAHCVEDGANVVIEATGKPAVYPMAVKLACVAGRLVATGSPRGTVEMNFLDEVHLREVSILGAIQPKTPNEDHIYFHWTKNRERDLLLRLMAEGRLTGEDLITHVAKPEDCLEIYTMLADNPKEALGVVFEW